MTNPQVVKSRKPGSKDAHRRNEPRNGIQKLLPVANFVEVPIREPFREKRLIENGLDTRLPAYLCQEFYPAVISGKDLEARIVEIHRRCYEESPATERESVIRDFVASCPHLVFKADWLAEIVTRHARKFDLSSGRRNRILTAMANGFRRAVDIRPRYQRFLHHGKVEYAREFRKEILTDLQWWEKTLDRPHATEKEEWWTGEVARRATDKTVSLIAEHPSLKVCKQKLTKLLCAGQHRKASFLIASTVWDVPEHDLQRKPA